MGNKKRTFEEGIACPTPITRHERVQLAHGSGGRTMADLISSCFVKAFQNPILSRLDDSAVLPAQEGRLVFTTDSYVVDPPFFPGGNIGDLAVNGTVNDLAVCGATPLFLSSGFILEEGFPLRHLEEIVQSMKLAAMQAGVEIVTGDTKVVDHGKADRIFINTAGIGILSDVPPPAPERIRSGDQIILSGTLADHGIAVLSRREGLEFETEIRSDSAPLNHMTRSILDAAPGAVHAMRDATRGGLAAVLNELSHSAGLQLELNEERIPVQPAVEGACELLGLDPLYVANEGKLVAFVEPGSCRRILEEMRNHSQGRMATVIGEVSRKRETLVVMKTAIGGRRIIDMPTGEQLPRIC